MKKSYIKSRVYQEPWIYRSLFSVHPIYTRASGSHRCVGTLEAPTSYGNNRLCLRAVDVRKLVEILIKGAILFAADCGSKYELHPRCSRLFYIRKWKKTRCIALLNCVQHPQRIAIDDSNCIICVFSLYSLSVR